MKALKSAFAESILSDPESVRAIERALSKAGYGLQNGIKITVCPVGADGMRTAPVPVNVHYVPKA